MQPETNFQFCLRKVIPWDLFSIVWRFEKPQAAQEIGIFLNSRYERYGKVALRSMAAPLTYDPAANRASMYLLCLCIKLSEYLSNCIATPWQPHKHFSNYWAMS